MANPPDASTVVFVSDAHFGGGANEAARRESFLRFLDGLDPSDRLVIVGDLFQFWFDLGRTLPQGFFDILAGLHRRRRAGNRIDYLAGNHDYWRGDFFRRELGIDTHDGWLDLDVQGRRLRIAHGDGAGPGDHGYKILKRIVRARATIEVARRVHPDLLHGFARWMGERSRTHTDRRPPAMERLEAAAAAAFAAGRDALVMGHVHAQVHRQLPGGELVVIGDWLELRSFVRLRGGHFHPGRWEASAPHDDTSLS
jgi:UDP-2,3-diacylglucosamine hydrolase